jgi:hypothetical protein
MCMNRRHEGRRVDALRAMGILRGVRERPLLGKQTRRLDEYTGSNQSYAWL